MKRGTSLGIYTWAAILPIVPLAIWMHGRSVTQVIDAAPSLALLPRAPAARPSAAPAAVQVVDQTTPEYRAWKLADAQRRKAQDDAVIQDIVQSHQAAEAGAYRVKRRVVDRVVKDASDAMPNDPIVAGPEAKSVLIPNVEPGSLLAALGIKKGDRLLAINGFDMADPAKALEAYARLRDAPHLTVTLVRDGALTNVDYDIE
jgi:membrane-associated protease RseP (regulator of RpoE activity)